MCWVILFYIKLNTVSSPPVIIIIICISWRFSPWLKCCKYTMYLLCMRMNFNINCYYLPLLLHNTYYIFILLLKWIKGALARIYHHHYEWSFVRWAEWLRNMRIENQYFGGEFLWVFLCIRKCLFECSCACTPSR